MTVTCTTHGQMQFDATRERWLCKGFDGEGCGSYLDAEEAERYGEERPVIVYAHRRIDGVEP